ncbi:hypothetical protein [Methylocystis sp. S23]
MVRKTTASASGDRRKRRLPPQQMDLFSRGVAAAGAPNWLDLPEDAREALISLMKRLILSHTQTTTKGAGHEH